MMRSQERSSVSFEMDKKMQVELLLGLGEDIYPVIVFGGDLFCAHSPANTRDPSGLPSIQTCIQT